MRDAGHQRGEAAFLLRLGGSERDGAHGASMERAEEGDDVLPLSVVAREFDGGFHGLYPRVAVVNPVRAGHRRDLREALGESHHALVVKIGSRHVD